jgi:enoyl-CoA hydratase
LSEPVPDAPEEAVLTSVVDRLLVITLNRPRVKNAINSALSLGVTGALAQLDTDDDLRVGVLTGSGSSFCAGMDLKEFARCGLPEGIDALYRHGCRKPLVAAVEGVALGGGLELALVADLLVAARDASLGSPEVRFGLFPGGGALVRLPQTLPRSVVAELALTGAPLSAQAALDHGLVVRLTEPGGALAAALELAGAIAQNAPMGLAAVKQLLRMAPGMTEAELWPEQRKLVAEVFNSDDAKEGARAFAEKRSPVWKGS